jgi:ribonuclease VapC
LIVDSSAVLAIIFDEPERGAFLRRMAASSPKMSVVSYVEVGLRLDRLAKERPQQAFDSIIRNFGVAFEPVSVEQAEIARLANKRYGKGSGHRARLNLGDCFTYALAKATGEPLLFKGDDFTWTDAVPAL